MQRADGRRIRSKYRPGVEPIEARLLLTGVPRAFEPGDLLVAVEGRVQWYDEQGQVVRPGGLATGPGLNTGMAFDAAGNLYVTRFSAGEIRKFSATGQDLGSFGWAADGTNPLAGQLPESIAFTPDGRLIVGTAVNGGDIYVFDAAGRLIDTHDVPTSPRAGTDRIALSDDGRILYYTSEDASIHRYNLADRLVLEPLATSLPLGRSHAIVRLPGGDMLVAGQAVEGAPVLQSAIERVTPAGVVSRTYDTGTLTDHNRWYVMALAADQQFVWAADESQGSLGGQVVQFDLAGDGRTALRTLAVGERVMGLLAVPALEVTSPGSDPSPMADLTVSIEPVATWPATSPTVGGLVTYRINATNNGPDASMWPTLSAQVPVGVTIISASAGAFDSSTGLWSASLGGFASGASVSVLLLVRPDQAGTFAILTSLAPTQTADPVDGNNTASLALSVPAVSGSDPSLGTAPRLTRVQRTGVAARLTRIQLTFSAGLDPATATSATHFTLMPLIYWQGQWRQGRALPIAAAEYDSGSQTVSLRPQVAIGLLARYRIIVSSAVLGSTGKPLEGTTTADFQGTSPVVVS